MSENTNEEDCAVSEKLCKSRRETQDTKIEGIVKTFKVVGAILGIEIGIIGLILGILIH